MGDLASAQSMIAPMGRSRPGRNTALEIVSPRSVVLNGAQSFSQLSSVSLFAHRAQEGSAYRLEVSG